MTIRRRIVSRENIRSRYDKKTSDKTHAMCTHSKRLKIK